jgi:hypothetical protein
MDSERFGAQITRTGFTKDVVTPLVSNQSDPEKKMVAIYDFVKNNFKYNDHDQLYADHNLRKALDTHAGSSADINLLLIAMLREAGLAASPVILSTRENGYVGITSYPNISKFDYVIGHVKIGEKYYLLDATEPLGMPNVLPVKCLNGEGLLVNAQHASWIPLAPGAKESEVHQSQFVIGKDNSMKGKIEYTSSGYAALKNRKNILAEGEKKYVDRLKNHSSNWEIEKIAIQHATTPAEALKVNYEISLPGQDQPVSIIYLNPMQGQGEKENPFKLETRKFPVDFAAPIEDTYLFNYTIPEGYKVEEQPKNAIVTLPENSGRFTYSISVMGNNITVLSKVNINRPIFQAEEYPFLKEFYNQIIAKHAEQIVIKKAN